MCLGKRIRVRGSDQAVFPAKLLSFQNGNMLESSTCWTNPFALYSAETWYFSLQHFERWESILCKSRRALHTDIMCLRVKCRRGRGRAYSFPGSITLLVKLLSLSNSLKHFQHVRNSTGQILSCSPKPATKQGRGEGGESGATPRTCYLSCISQRQQQYTPLN